ncbi:MAG: hypothetical protein GTO13_22590 [Proteobacteria bacterium]|nr:hypothetical protein [Pseudomonadota bacterium]
MISLTLVGTIHRDPNGLPRLMEILERESPDIITLEMSEYSVAFREKMGPYLKGKLFQILQSLHGKFTRKQRGKLHRPNNPFQIGAIQAILQALELPFEFRAVKAYCERARISFRCIDVSKYSWDKLKRLGDEMITEDNMRKILAFAPMDPHEELGKQRALARRLISRDADQLFIEAFLHGKMGDGMVPRDRYMSLRIKEILKDHGKTLHVGGWEHLLDDPGGKTLYGILKGLRPHRILSL